MPVGRRLRQDLARDAAARRGPIVDHDLLGELFRNFAGDESHHDVGRSARSERDDEADGTRGIRLLRCICGLRCTDCTRDRRGAPDRSHAFDLLTSSSCLRYWCWSAMYYRRLIESAEIGLKDVRFREPRDCFAAALLAMTVSASAPADAQQ